MIDFSTFLHFFTHFQERKNSRKIKRFSDLPTLFRLWHVSGNKAIFILRIMISNCNKYRILKAEQAFCLVKWNPFSGLRDC